jgi:peptide/nickel transport system substrate-binding protein/oligopeptide transport system substrate-binding protein
MRNKKALFALVVFVVFSLVVTLFTGCDLITNTAAATEETAVSAETSPEETTKIEESVTTEPANQPKAGGIMRLHIDEPVTLDPPNANESEGMQIVQQLWDGLFTYDPITLEIKPELCEKYEISDDGLTYTFYIKKGVKFHSGKELKAEDFVYSWTRAVLKENAASLAYHFEPIVGYDECQDGSAAELTGIKALDDYSFQVSLKYQYADFINTLGYVAFYPVNKESIEKAGEAAGEMPDGTGPFEFVKWEHDQYVELARNDDYYVQKAYLDGAKYIIIPDDQTAFLEFQAENIEETNIPIGQVKAVQADPQWKDGVIIHPILGLYYYGMNMNAEPFKDNIALRETINYIIDRQNICEILSEGVSSPATGIVPPGIPGFQENVMEYTFDLEKAKAKLAEAGYPEGKGLPTISLAYFTESGSNAIIAEAIQSDALKIGINIKLDGYEYGTFSEKAHNGELSLFVHGWQADYPTMDNFLYPLFYSQSADNFIGYNNPEVDKLLIEARSRTDKDQREAKYQEIEKMILKDAATAPIYFFGISRIIQPYVKGFVLNNMGSYDLTPVWLDK